MISICTILGVTPVAAIRSGHEANIPPDRHHAKLNWERGLLTVRLEAEIPNDLATNPSATRRVKRRLERRIDEPYLDAVNRLQLNSAQKVEAALNRDADLTTRIRRTADALVQRYTGPTADLTSAAVEFSLDIHPTLTRTFAAHTHPRPVPRVRGWHPSRSFTGVVIYATDALPVHGEDRSETPVPALLPRLHDDERFETLFEPGMVESRYLERWGPVGYTQPGHETRFVQRVGNTPLRVLASGVYGTQPTDLMVPREHAVRLLSREENRRLLAEGRVLIVLHPDKLIEPVLAE